jgi:hypothetical protein
MMERYAGRNGAADGALPYQVVVRSKSQASTNTTGIA